MVSKYHRRPWSFLLLGLLGVLAFGCKCSPSYSNSMASQRVPSASVAATAAPAPPIPIETDYVTAIRARRFADARALLARLSEAKQREAPYRFVNAYLAVRVGDGAAALPLLAELESQLPELAPDIARLRAEAELYTPGALVGAAWLDEHGRSDAWLEAARQLSSQGQRELALDAIERGLARNASRKGFRNATLLAELRAMRLELSSRSEDLLWLAEYAPSHVQSRERIDRALDDGSLVLEPSRHLARLRRLADAGAVERLDREIAPLMAKAPRLVSKGLAAYLRGRVRQVARLDQKAGADLLERAADLHAEEPTQLRFDAARMNVREGRLPQALRAYDRAAELDRARREEAQFYAARAAAILGEPRRGIERFSQLIERAPKGRFRALAELERTLTLFAVGEVRQAEPLLTRLADDPNQREQRPRLLELAGLASFLLGREDEAVERWQSAMKEAPFGLASSFAAARLRASNRAVPALSFDSTPSGRNAPLPLPRRTNQLLAFGMDELAAAAFHAETASKDVRGDAAIAQLCEAWAKISYGERGYVASRVLREAVDLSAAPSPESKWKWDCRFPRPYASMTEEFENEYRLPRGLLHAVMRQESGFDPVISSPVGATGLMQLMPKTANRLAEELRLSSAPKLEEPRENLRLGAAYLRKLLDAFDQNLVLAVAAYNAGPRAVELWASHAGTSAVELFAERIPYAETHKYVERVISNLLVYRYLGGLGRDFEGLSLSLPKELKDSSSLY